MTEFELEMSEKMKDLLDKQNREIKELRDEIEEKNDFIRKLKEEMTGQSTARQYSCYTVHDFMIDQLGLSGGLLLVYAVLYTHCSQFGSYSSGVEFLSKMTGSTERAVQLNLKKLEKQKLIFKSCRSSNAEKYEYSLRAIKF